MSETESQSIIPPEWQDQCDAILEEYREKLKGYKEGGKLWQAGNNLLSHYESDPEALLRQARSRAQEKQNRLKLQETIAPETLTTHDPDHEISQEQVHPFRRDYKTMGRHRTENRILGYVRRKEEELNEKDGVNRVTGKTPKIKGAE